MTADEIINRYRMMGELVCWFEELLPKFENEKLKENIVKSFEIEIKYLSEEQLEQLYSDHIGGVK